MNGSFEDIVPTFLDESIDQFIAVADPALIDEKSEERWKPFYRSVCSEAKKEGRSSTCYKLTDELLQL